MWLFEDDDLFEECCCPLFGKERKWRKKKKKKSQRVGDAFLGFNISVKGRPSQEIYKMLWKVR